MNYFSSIPQLNPAILMAILIWSLFWKIIALWRAAKGNQKRWFVILFLPLNTFGILEIVYLFKFAKNKLSFEDLKKSNLLPN